MIIHTLHMRWSQLFLAYKIQYWNIVYMIQNQLIRWSKYSRNVIYRYIQLKHTWNVIYSIVREIWLELSLCRKQLFWQTSRKQVWIWHLFFTFINNYLKQILWIRDSFHDNQITNLFNMILLRLKNIYLLQRFLVNKSLFIYYEVYYFE